MRHTIADRVSVLTDSSFGSKQSFTQEGFLYCRDVCIARTGEQHYLADELPELEAAGGIIIALREPEEVFREETIRSFEGKDIVDDHPDDAVNPQNYKLHSVGVVLNPRRGDVNLGLADFIIADLLIKDADAIAAVRAGKREVSCGYDAEYEQIGPGKARQRNIIGNHVAIVDRGRCGHACAIGDQEMPKTKMSFKDRFLAFLDDAEEEEKKEEKKEVKDGLNEKGVVFNLHVGPHGATMHNMGDEDKEDKEDKKEDTKDGVEERMSKLEKDMKIVKDGIGALIKDSKAKDKKSADGDDDDEDSDDDMTGDADGEEEKEEKAEKKETKDSLTKDSRHMSDDYREVISLGEIIAPGLTVPKFVADAKPKATNDAMCLHRRRAMAKFSATEDGKVILKKITGRTSIKDAMPCGELAVLFNSAAAMVQDARADVGTLGKARQPRTNDKAFVPQNIADANAMKRDFWKNN